MRTILAAALAASLGGAVLPAQAQTSDANDAASSGVQSGAEAVNEATILPPGESAAIGRATTGGAGGSTDAVTPDVSLPDPALPDGGASDLTQPGAVDATPEASQSAVEGGPALPPRETTVLPPRETTVLPPRDGSGTTGSTTGTILPDAGPGTSGSTSVSPGTSVDGTIQAPSSGTGSAGSTAAGSASGGNSAY